MYNNGNSSKNVTGASVVDGTMESADFPDNGLSADKIDGGTLSNVNVDDTTAANIIAQVDNNEISGDKIDAGVISNFQSTGIDDRLPTGKVLTLGDSATTIISALTIDKDEGAPADFQTNLDIKRGWDTGDSTDRYTGLAFTDNNTVQAGIYANRLASHVNYKSDLAFYVNAGSSSVTPSVALTKVMTIRSGGSVNIGRTDGVYGFDLQATGTAMRTNRDGSDGQVHVFSRSDTQVGSITVTTSATSFNTSSDYRLKENVVPMAGSIDRLKALKPSRFNFISNAETTVDGFLAHEAGEVVPECVTGTKDAMKTEEYEVTPAIEATYDENGNEVTPSVEAVMGTREVEDYQAIDQSKLVPLLVSALQEAIARIETLENA
jgi:hypothetical protein